MTNRPRPPAQRPGDVLKIVLPDLALMDAAAHGTPEEIDAAIRAGATLDYRNANNHTALMMSIRAGNAPNAEHLLRLGADRTGARDTARFEAGRWAVIERGAKKIENAFTAEAAARGIPELGAIGVRAIGKAIAKETASYARICQALGVEPPKLKPLDRPTVLEQATADVDLWKATRDLGYRFQRVFFEIPALAEKGHDILKTITGVNSSRNQRILEGLARPAAPPSAGPRQG